MENQGYQHYRDQREQNVLEMNQNELLLLLYDELVKQLIRCDLALKKQDFNLLEDSADRSLAILRHLDDTLDMQYPISWDLRRIYDYLIYDLGLVRAGRERRFDEIGRIRHILSELREAFEGASKKVNDTHMVRENAVRG